MLIGTMKEFKEDLYGYISDASKDAQGFRTRFNYRDLTVEELMKEGPIGPLAYELMGPMGSRIMSSAQELGYSWQKLNKFICSLEFIERST